MYTGYDLPVFMIQAQKDELNWTLVQTSHQCVTALAYGVFVIHVPSP
jgi:hypothetical protein